MNQLLQKLILVMQLNKVVANTAKYLIENSAIVCREKKQSSIFLC